MPPTSCGSRAATPPAGGGGAPARAPRWPPTRDDLPPRDDDQARVGAERRPREVAVALRLREPGPVEHREQLRRGVDAQRERPRVAAAAGLDQRLRRLRESRGGVERALLEQQPPLAEHLPVLLVEAAHEQVAMHDLDDESAAGAQDAADLAERARVLLVAEVAERREEVERRVEARIGERQVAVVGPHELRPPLAAGAARRLVEQRLRAIDADHAIAGARERERVAAEAARHVEEVAAGRARRELRGRDRLRLGRSRALVLAERAQVELGEER